MTARFLLLAAVLLSGCRDPAGVARPPDAPPADLQCRSCGPEMPTSIYPDRIDISWTDGDASGAVTRIYLAGVQIREVALGASPESITDLESDTDYLIGLRHLENGIFAPLETSPAVEVTIRTLKGTLGVPQNLATQALAPAKVQLTWQAGTDGTGASYVIERSPDGSTGWVQIGTTGVGVLTFTHHDLAQEDVQHFFRVKAQRPKWFDSAFTSAVAGTYGAANHFARPIQDITVGGFAATPLWDKLDEVSPDDGTTQIAKTLTPGVHTYEVKLSDLGVVFDSGVPIVIRVRHRKVGTSGAVIPTISLFEGTTQRATSGALTDLTDSWRTETLTLTPAERAAIVDESNLRVRVSVDNTATFDHAYRSTWIELENDD